MQSKRHSKKWYLEEVNKYAEIVNSRGYVKVSVDTEEILITTESGFYDAIRFCDVNTDEKLNRSLERLSIAGNELHKEKVKNEIRYFCRDGLMVGLHRRFPRIFDAE